MAGFMAVGADDGHLSECAIFAIKKTNGTYVWPEARGPRLGLEKQPAVAAQWVARAMFVDARSHVGDPRRGSPCTVGSAGGQSITTVRQAPVGAIDYRLHAPRPEEGQSSAATGYAGALAPKAPPRRQLAGAGLWGSCQPAERERPQTWPAAFAFLARQATASRGKGRPFWHKRETAVV